MYLIRNARIFLQIPRENDKIMKGLFLYEGAGFVFFMRLLCQWRALRARRKPG